MENLDVKLLGDSTIPKSNWLVVEAPDSTYVVYKRTGKLKKRVEYSRMPIDPEGVDAHIWFYSVRDAKDYILRQIK